MRNLTPFQRLARRLAGMVIVFFLGLGVFWPELRFRLFASTAVATVTSVSITARSLDYRFAEPGGAIRLGSALNIDILSAPKVGDPLDVQYFPAPSSQSRLVSSAEAWPLVVAGIVGVLMVVGAVLAIGDLRALRRARSQPVTPALA